MTLFSTNATEDSWTKDTSPDENFNGDSYLRLGVVGSPVQTRYIHIQFDISSLPYGIYIASAVLKIHVVYQSSNVVNIKKETSTFDETTLTWNNKPAVYGSKISQTINSVGWWELDVKNLLETAVGDATFGCELSKYSGGAELTVDKRETASYIPQLIVNYSLTPYDYYVKTTGNDALDGTSWANAWATINKAATTVADGKTVHIEHGEYSQSAALKVAPQNAGELGIKYRPEPVGGGDTAATVKVTMT